MTPEFTWQGGEIITKIRKQFSPLGGSVVVEGVFGLNNLRHIFTLQQALVLQRSVCRLSMGPGTGFLISPNLIMTNNHILPNIEAARNCIARFNFQLALGFVAEPVEEFQLEPDGFFLTNPQHDFTVCMVKGDPGKKWGHLALRRASPQVGSAAFLIQHPSGGHKKISLGDNEIKAIVDLDTRLHYLTDTMPGSSGSPILDDSMMLIGLHRASKLTADLSGYFCNEGVNINTIIDNLPQEVPVESR